MNEDERAIRELVAAWLDASRRGDNGAVSALMSDDVLFLVPGRPAFDKAAFESMQASLPAGSFEATSEVQEIGILGDHAYCRTWLRVSMQAQGGPPVVREGGTLSLLRRESGRWRLFRDANLLALVGN